MIRRVLKWGLVAGLAFLTIVGGYGFYLYRQVRAAAGRDEAQPVDAIIVMGAAQYKGKPSPVLKARLDHVLELYRMGYSKSIITTGSYGADPDFSEAHVSTQYLISWGIDRAAIVTDQGGGNTRDSIRTAANLMHSKSWRSALVVSDGFHLYRVKRMLEEQGIEAFTSPAPASRIETSAWSERLWYSFLEVLKLLTYRWIHL